MTLETQREAGWLTPSLRSSGHVWGSTSYACPMQSALPASSNLFALLNFNMRCTNMHEKLKALMHMPPQSTVNNKMFPLQRMTRLFWCPILRYSESFLKWNCSEFPLWILHCWGIDTQMIFGCWSCSLLNLFITSRSFFVCGLFGISYIWDQVNYE